MSSDDFLYKKLLKDFLLKFERFLCDKDKDFKKLSFDASVRDNVKNDETILLWSALLQVLSDSQVHGKGLKLESVLEDNSPLFNGTEFKILQQYFKDFVEENKNDWDKILSAIHNRTKEQPKEKRESLRATEAINKAIEGTEYELIDNSNITRTFHRIIGGIIETYSGNDYQKIRTNTGNKIYKYFRFSDEYVPTLQELWRIISPGNKTAVKKIVDRLEKDDVLKKKTLLMVSDFLKLNFKCDDIKKIEDEFQSHIDDIIKNVNDVANDAIKHRNDVIDAIEMLFRKLQKCFVFLKKRHV